MSCYASLLSFPKGKWPVLLLLRVPFLLGRVAFGDDKATTTKCESSAWLPTQILTSFHFPLLKSTKNTPAMILSAMQTDQTTPAKPHPK